MHQSTKTMSSTRSVPNTESPPQIEKLKNVASSSSGKGTGTPPPAASQRKTEIGMRIFQEAKKNPKVSGRSQDVVPLQRDCERLLKHLQELLDVARKYKQTMADMETTRVALCKKTEALATDTQLPLVLGARAASLQESKINLIDKITNKNKTHQQQYQDKVLDYAQEWHTTVRKMMETEVAKTQDCHKTVRHYEDKVAKLHKQKDNKETAGKSPNKNQTEKLERNETKLADAWKEYDSSATNTANLLEATTKTGWKDLYPLINAMVAFEQDRDADERKLWDFVGRLGDRLVDEVAQYQKTVSKKEKTHKEEKKLDEEPDIPVEEEEEKEEYD